MDETNKNQEGETTKKMRRNPWILSTFVLGIFCVVLLANMVFTFFNFDLINLTQNPSSAWDKYVESGLTVDCKTERETNNLCFVAERIPSWVVDGQVSTSGYSNFGGSPPSLVVDTLIDNGVTLVYHSDCPACQKQVSYFNGGEL